MFITPTHYTASLTARMDKAYVELPITTNDTNTLLSLLADEDYTYLTLRDTTGAEVIKVTNSHGTLLLERGVDGTTARNFPRGTCVRFEMVPQVVKELICTYDCCEGECPCNAVAAAGVDIPPAKVGTAWYGSAVFTGDTPMQLASSGLPAWVTVKHGANYVSLSGTPTATGTFAASFAATNCDGKVAVQSASLVVTS